MKILVMGLPGSGVGYVFEEEVFDKSITDVSATKIRMKMREEGDL